MKPKIIFRADGDRKIGLGHIFRSLAVAEMLKKEFYCSFMTRSQLPSIHRQILQTCESLIKIPSTKDHLHEARTLLAPVLSGREIVVLDGYHFDSEYQQIIQDHGSQLVCIDDIYKTYFMADAIINHAGGVKKEQYSASKQTRFFLGPKYALLRPEFCEAAKNRRKGANERNYFICLGGADPHNDTLKVLRKCASVGHAQRCYVITGAAYAYGEELDRYIANSKMDTIRLSDLDAIRMVKVMQQCGTAICPPSSISYEYLSVGGILYLHQIANNQNQIRNFLIEAKAAFSFDDYPLKDPIAITRAKEKQAQIFKGESPKNILQIFKTLCHAINMPSS